MLFKQVHILQACKIKQGRNRDKHPIDDVILRVVGSAQNILRKNSAERPKTEVEQEKDKAARFNGLQVLQGIIIPETRPVRLRYLPEKVSCQNRKTLNDY